MSWYKSREDEPGYIEGQRRANETDAEYEARLAGMRERFTKEIQDALGGFIGTFEVQATRKMGKYYMRPTIWQRIKHWLKLD